jgi:hypothetical protein
MQVEQRVKALRLLEQRHLAQARHPAKTHRTARARRTGGADASPGCRATESLMRLQELTSAERAFLTAPAAMPDGLSPRLTRKLAATLSARLRLPVKLALQPAVAPAAAPATPLWQPDAALAGLWLTRRLGGRRTMGAASFVPHTLIHTLDAALAESWLDEAAQTAPRRAGLAHHHRSHAGNARRAVAAPHNRHDALGARSDPAWLDSLRQARCC